MEISVTTYIIMFLLAFILGWIAILEAIFARKKLTEPMLKDAAYYMGFAVFFMLLEAFFNFMIGAGFWQWEQVIFVRTYLMTSVTALAFIFIYLAAKRIGHLANTFGFIDHISEKISSAVKPKNKRQP